MLVPVLILSGICGVEALKCYLCMGRECKNGLCDGYWCKRSSVVDDGVRKYRYACEDDPSIPPGCMDIEVFGYTMQTCFCDDSDYCTGRFDAMDLLEPEVTEPPLDIRPVTSPSVVVEGVGSSGTVQAVLILLTIPTLLYLGYRRFRQKRKATTSPRPTPRPTHKPKKMKKSKRTPSNT